MPTKKQILEDIEKAKIQNDPDDSDNYMYFQITIGPDEIPVHSFRVRKGGKHK